MLAVVTHDDRGFGYTPVRTPVQMGDVAQAAVKGVGSGLQVATPAIAHAISSAAWAVPVVGAAVAGVTLALSFFFAQRAKHAAQKIQSTHLVDDLEAQMMKPNVAGYLNGPRTRASQQVAMQNFLDFWAWLKSQEACGNPALENAGKNCVRDRDRGGRWDWWSYYYDPIANDPQVRDTAESNDFLAFLKGGGSAGGTSSPGGLPGWVLPAAAIAAAVAFL